MEFDSLNLIDVNEDVILSETPYGVDYGYLSNGLTYYVRLNSKPSMRASLALVVNVGSVVEEEEERGVAHLVEHLAFRDTTNYRDNQMVKDLETIGVPFGACQNAYTSADETVYHFFVPVDQPDLLSKSISVLAEFSSEVCVLQNGLNTERGVVLEEGRRNRTAEQRIADAVCVRTLEGSKYAERLPIGLENVISKVSCDTVNGFYKKWYHMKNMALIAVGDFENTQSVVDLIKKHFGGKTSAHPPRPIPQFLVPPYQDPRISCLVDSEASGSYVMVSCNVPVDGMKTVKDYKNFLAQSMFFIALNRRFYKLYHKKDAPYFSCGATFGYLVRPIKTYKMASPCEKNGTNKALESMLTEVARVRLHGFSDREISIARAWVMSDIKEQYLQRDEMESDDLKNECVQHFLRNEPVLDIGYEAQLHKTLLSNISASEVSKYSENFRTSSSCVIKTIEPQVAAIEDALRKVVLKVNSLEEQGSICRWDDETIPEEIVSKKPYPGDLEQQLGYSYMGANEMILSNGMRVCYKCTNFSKDQIIFTGFSYGGVSEFQEHEYMSCSMGSIIAREIGMFGYRPPILTDMLAGKKVDVKPSLGPYMRSFSGSCSPSDLETVLQLVYQLFVTDVKPGVEDDVKVVMQMAEEAILAIERNPKTAFADRVKKINYGNSYFFRSIKISDIRNLDPVEACDYFNKCFKDPSTFTVVIVGNIDPGIAFPLILQYLGGIPRPPKPIMNFKREELKGLPYTFPSTVIREIVRSPMLQARCSVQLCFPVELKHENMMEEHHLSVLLSKLLETKMQDVLRFKHGQIYSVDVSVYLGRNYTSTIDNIRGNINIEFTCDPGISSKLVNLALDEILRLQKEGPLNDEVSTILEIEQRDYEIGLQKNNDWLERISSSYQWRTYSGDVGACFQMQDEGRISARNSLTPLTAQSALQRIIPFPCTNLYTLVILMPQQSSHFKKLKSVIIRSKEATIMVGVAGLALLALGLWISQTK